jgi:DNA polymerase III delta prime subunit
MADNKFNPKNRVWTEKYRPQKVSQMIGDFKHKILNYLQDPSSIPNFLLYSKTPGTGKTTLAKCIINELNCDALILNSSDDRKIEVIREKVKEFSMTQSSKPGLKRAVFLDEFDGMLRASQDAMRNIMETYSDNVFYILTCNSINKVIEPLQSRCVLIPFSFPEKTEVYKYLEMICHNEKMDYTEEGLMEVINQNHPSIRNCVIVLQDLYTQGLAVIKENIKPVNAIFDELWDLLKQKDWHTVKKVVIQSSVDAVELNKEFWYRAASETPENIKIMQIACKNEIDFSRGSDPIIVFATSLFEMVK